MIRKIVKIGDDVLRKECNPVEKFNLRLQLLLRDMAETMYEANGVGLAAPQVGILRRVAVVDVGDGLLELVNPVITYREGEQKGTEGCLSIPGRQGCVTRPYKIKVKAQDCKGRFFELEAEEFFARAICHELDHLDGIMYIDFMDYEIFPEDEETEEEGEK